jgi:FMN phosphatase YigB (HAD superfamily)
MDAVPNIRAVVFDAFGTLVEIGEQRRPFGRLMKWIRENHAAPADDEAAWLMRYSFDLHGAAKAAGIIPPAELMERLSDDLAAERRLRTLCPRLKSCAA